MKIPEYLMSVAFFHYADTETDANIWRSIVMQHYKDGKRPRIAKTLERKSWGRTCSVEWNFF